MSLRGHKAYSLLGRRYIARLNSTSSLKEETPPISSPPDSLRYPFEPPNCQQIRQEFSESNVSLIYTVGA